MRALPWDGQDRVVKLEFKNGEVRDAEPEDDEDDEPGEGAPVLTEREEEVQAVLQSPEVDDVHRLARVHDKLTVDTLAELCKCRGRQAMVAAVAAMSLHKIGHPEMTKAQVEAMVETRLKEMIADAERRKLASAAGAR